MTKKHFVSIGGFLPVIVVAICTYCPCTYGQSESSSSVTNDVMISHEGLKIAFDLVFDIYLDTNFDEFIGRDAYIGREIKPMSDVAVVDRRQYREGYISTMKHGILTDGVIDYHIDSLRDKDVKIGNYFPGTSSVDHVLIHRKNSTYYGDGAREARKKLRLFLSQLWNDVSKTKSKYSKYDRETYFKHGEYLPDEVWKERIEEIPRLQAIIFLRDRLRNFQHNSPMPVPPPQIAEPNAQTDEN
ncbi:MAG: hypothetical protein FWD31_00405 [Planctomycetaceae bacterium]|nr:hypothetical protein [Planctomycetaceae bacterium]